LPVAVAQGQDGTQPLASGAVLKVIATDAGSQRDFRTFARLAGHTLLREEDEAGVYRYWLKKA
jgi:TusA-related sulfurtransferase